MGNSDMFMRAIACAADLIGDDPIHVRYAEYSRGQVELIRDMFDLNMEADDAREYILLMIEAEIFRSSSIHRYANR